MNTIGTNILKYILPHIIFEAASRFPDKVAFKCGSSSITFAELVKRSGQLAYLLKEVGVKRGDRVGVFLDRRIQNTESIYGIMLLGAIYVPLDPFAPASRNCARIKDCGITVLITHPSLSRKVASINSEVPLDFVLGLSNTEDVRTASWSDLDLLPDYSAPKVLEQDLAYILYTSGSTGIAKGIMHSHYSGLSYAKLSAHLYGLNPNDVIATHSPLHFDISTFGYLSAPLSCATSIIIPEAHIRVPASLSQMIEKESVTVWYSVPLALVKLLRQGVLNERNLSKLRWVLYAGEPFPSTLR